MLILGIVGLISLLDGVGGDSLLGLYSLLGMGLNLLLWLACVRCLTSSQGNGRKRRPWMRLCGVMLIVGYGALTVFPAPNSENAIGYRAWTCAFLFGGIGTLMSTFHKPIGEGEVCGPGE